ncbi:MAG: hypothetical protein NC489_09015 [Ruminococcus flavefaciens]|nr:hypothetical protein [Ruminococcus flavefaciens]
MLQGQLEQAKALIAEQKMKIDQFGEYKRVDAEYLRDVQKQLAEEFHMHPVFGFPNSVGLPGSTAITTSRSGFTTDSEGFTTARGRVILDDKVTKEINKTPHIYEKIQLVVNYLDQYGNLSRIMRDLVYNGGMSIVLAYREDTTTYEAFFETTVKNHAAVSILKFDSDTGCVIADKDEEKKEEG